MIRIAFSFAWFNRKKKATHKNIYTKCNELPLDRFIDILLYNNFSRLIIKGSVKNDLILKSIWENIYSEYCEISGSDHYKKIFNLIRDIKALESKLLSLNICIIILSGKYSFYCVTTLKKLGYNYKFDTNDIESYTKDMQSLSNASKMISLTIKQKQKEYDEFIKKSETGDKLTEESFYSQLSHLSKFCGYQIKASQTTVLEYCALLKNYQNYTKNLIKNNGK